MCSNQQEILYSMSRCETSVMKFLNRSFVKTYPLRQSAKAKTAILILTVTRLTVIRLIVARRAIAITIMFWYAQ